MVITDELHEELNQVAVSNAQAYANLQNGLAPGEDAANNALEDIGEKLDRNKSGGASDAEKDEGQLSPKVLVMQPILRFLQLLCENHNRELQVLPSIRNLYFCYEIYILILMNHFHLLPPIEFSTESK